MPKKTIPYSLRHSGSAGIRKLCLFPNPWRRRRHGFTLIEILLSVFLILAIISILFTAASTYVTSRGTNLAGTAAKIASRQIETLRQTAYDSLPASGSFSDPDLTKLPQGQASQTLSDYQSSPDVKQVLLEIAWVENAAAKQVKMETLIYRYGI